jgi:hypothetical protein
MLATAIPGAAWYTSATGYGQTICRLAGTKRRPRLGAALIAVSRERAVVADQILVRGVQRMEIENHSVGGATTRGPDAMLVDTA